MTQVRLDFGREADLVTNGTRAIELDDFPFEAFTETARMESWRKEVNRPIYYLHKWWAHRLGSVFRAILLGTFLDSSEDLLSSFYQPLRFPGLVVFDPFMGSGTTVGETLKLGARAIGRDINPVAYFLVKNALTDYKVAQVRETYRNLERGVSEQIGHYYRARLPSGREVPVLYYFWVKVLECPECTVDIDLFSSLIFSRHAYPSRYPVAKALCSGCGEINDVRYDATQVSCSRCELQFNPQEGPANRTRAVCGQCATAFSIVQQVRRSDQPPRDRLYAKMVLLPSGKKEYLAVDSFDLALYDEASKELKRRSSWYPVVQIEPGYNTNQVLRYGYTHWHQMFNARQLLCLGMLAEQIRAIKDENLRDLFTCLFSGVLEFNNMFASFKGEGTGAVRHMFSHHILKPERTPLEANPWGTPKSSGSFSTLYRSRVLRALTYRQDPFELKVVSNGQKKASKKVFGLSVPLGFDVAKSAAKFGTGAKLYLSCGDSSSTDLPSESVDAVVTDPPFFDNVHYSQLADFFHVWQRHILGANGVHQVLSTREAGEVQHSDESVFAKRLGSVFQECNRVLKEEGLLVFTYHHSRREGWAALVEALMWGGFGIVAAHPVKAEMSVAVPKQQAKEPIDLDVIIVCRKRNDFVKATVEPQLVIDKAKAASRDQIKRLRGSALSLSRNDIKVIFMAQVIRSLSQATSADGARDWLESWEDVLLETTEELIAEAAKR